MTARNFRWEHVMALLAIVSLMIFVIGCEGPAGPAGPAGSDGTNGSDGTDGVDGQVACLGCHSTDNMNENMFQYVRSEHFLGSYVDYAGGRGTCARCHSGGGFKEFMIAGEVDGNLFKPEPIGCDACHSIHATFESQDFALRASGPVVSNVDATYSFDFGDNSNLCANCHQSRTAEPNIASPGATFSITSTHYGPHHGPQANVLAAFGFAEIPGSVAYTGESPHLEDDATCVTCHMGTYSNGAGGHTWWPNLDNCLECHSGLTSFDRHSVQTETQTDLDTLRDKLVALGVIEYIAEDDAYEPVVHDPVVPIPMVQAQAYFNWVGISEDRSLGVHNPQYVHALLTNTIAALP